MVDGPAISEPECIQFFAQWKQLARDTLMPHTSAFLNDPVPELIPFVQILDLIQEGQRIRFMGTGLVDLCGRDSTNEIFGETLPPEMKSALDRRSHTLVEHPCGLMVLADFSSPTGRPFSMETVLLPLAVDTGRPPRICAYSKVIDEIDQDDGATARFEQAQTHSWLDIGCGVPDWTPSP